ncbi:HNH endonuclease signature motif containing protein [Klenkia marina]|uniref:HNH endonuclease signature motif containing protein n=1 Tax=Klenkia marina TaxID=1960309 RepID=UPI000B889845|nr:HNH endonuclease signature motif containing protein [Klenkia marina]
MAAARRRPEPPPPDVAAVLDALLAAAATDLRPRAAPLSAAQLLDRVRGLGRAVNVLQAELARTVVAAEDAEAAFTDGLTHMAGWLRGHLNTTGAESKAVLAAGRLQQRMPVLGAAAASGAVSPGQLAVVGRILTDRVWELGEVAGVDLATLDQLVTDTATGDQARCLPQVCQRIADQLDPDGPEPVDPTAGRSLRFTRRADGSRGIRGDLDAIGGEKVEAALEAIAAAGRCEGDLRSRGQRTADALVQLADLHLAAGDLPVLRGTKPQVTALVQLGDLLDPTLVEAATTLGSGAVVSNLAARAAACDAVVNRVVLGPDGLPLDVGRTHRLVPAHIRRAAEVRDGGCIFAGCHNPTWMCDAHHVVHWIDGGDTSLENTALLCERHHTQVHHGFAIRWDPDDGRWRTSRPDGSEILVGPVSGDWPQPPPDGPLFVDLPLGA